MADNYTTNAGAGGSTFASDEISSVQHPRVKVEWGTDGTVNDAQISAPLPTQTTIESTQMTNVGTVVTPKFAVITASSSGNNSLVSAVSGKKIRVLALWLTANGTVNVKFVSATTPDITGLAYLVVNTGFVLPFNPVGWFETATTSALQINLSAGTAVGGSLTYVEI